MKKSLVIALGAVLLMAVTVTPAFAKKHHRKHHKKHHQAQNAEPRS